MSELIAYWKDEFVEVVLEKGNKGLAMFINGGLQFTERDEYRYHQMLFLMPTLFFKNDIDVLVLGGGDGLGVRELLTQKHVKSIDLVDISPFIVNLAKYHPEMRRINRDSFWSDKLNVIIGDGYEYVHNTNKKYDLIIMDYPDPSIREDDPVNKLFTVDHFKGVKSVLKDNGIVSMQSTSVIISPNVFRLLILRKREVYKNVIPLRINVNSYTDIGIIYASDDEIEIVREIPPHAFFSKESIGSFMVFHRDELPDIPDEVLKEKHISEVIAYDLYTRRKV